MIMTVFRVPYSATVHELGTLLIYPHVGWQRLDVRRNLKVVSHFYSEDCISDGKDLWARYVPTHYKTALHAF